MIGWMLALGCPRDDEEPPPPPTHDTGDPTPTGPTGDTGAPTFTSGVRASCAVDPLNTLRYHCDVDTLPAQGVELSFADVAGARPARIVRAEAASEHHRLDLVFMTPETEYGFEVVGLDDPSARASGTFRTAAVPSGAAAELRTLEGATSAPMLGMASPCIDGAYAVIVDPGTGQPIWYQDLAVGPLGFLDAVSFTEDETVLAVVDGAIQEVDLLGNPLLTLIPGEELTEWAHHDVFRKDGLTYALFQETISLVNGEFVLDGFYVFSGAERVGEWHLADHWVPTEDNGLTYPIDASHANAIWVDDDLRVTLSLRHLSAILSIDGDPASPTFGAVDWTLSNPTSALPSDIAVVANGANPPDFEQQHNPWWTDDGHLTFLDNRISLAENSRIVELAVDPTSLEATFVRTWELPLHCDFQGGAWRTAGGANPLATCAPTRDGFEFDGATGATVWHGNVTCGDEFGMYIPRFVPLDW